MRSRFIIQRRHDEYTLTEGTVIVYTPHNRVRDLVKACRRTQMVLILYQDDTYGRTDIIDKAKIIEL